MKRGARTFPRDPAGGFDHQSPAEALSFPGRKHVEIVEKRARVLVHVQYRAHEPGRLPVAGGDEHQNGGRVSCLEFLPPDGAAIRESAIVEVLVGKETAISATPALRVERCEDFNVTDGCPANLPGTGSKLFSERVEVPEDPEALQFLASRVEESGA